MLGQISLLWHSLPLEILCILLQIPLAISLAVIRTSGTRHEV